DVLVGQRRTPLKTQIYRPIKCAMFSSTNAKTADCANNKWGLLITPKKNNRAGRRLQESKPWLTLKRPMVRGAKVVLLAAH
ncbi:MAG: hypothetical protein AAF939_09935, partial [Planctomycetota bacterium]